jgi:hypothetical protein
MDIETTVLNHFDFSRPLEDIDFLAYDLLQIAPVPFGHFVLDTLDDVSRQLLLESWDCELSLLSQPPFDFHIFSALELATPSLTVAPPDSMEVCGAFVAPETTLCASSIPTAVLADEPLVATEVYPATVVHPLPLPAVPVEKKKKAAELDEEFVPLPLEDIEDIGDLFRDRRSIPPHSKKVMPRAKKAKISKKAKKLGGRSTKPRRIKIPARPTVPPPTPMKPTASTLFLLDPPF